MTTWARGLGELRRWRSLCFLPSVTDESVTNLCPFSVSCGRTTLPHHVLMCLICLCLPEVHTWQKREALGAPIRGLRVYTHSYSSFRIELHLAVYEVDRQDGAIFSEPLTLPDNHSHSHLLRLKVVPEKCGCSGGEDVLPLLCGTDQISR